MRWALWLAAALGPAAMAAVNLLEVYPTKLTAGDTAPGRARKWTFEERDLFRVTGFSFKGGEEFSIEVGEADLGLGRSEDGAVWALVMPRGEGKLIRGAAAAEQIAHVWLRFHPGEIEKLFPAESVARDGRRELMMEMRLIAGAKMGSSWQAGGAAMIPEPGIMTVDVDTKGGLRRFYQVDLKANKFQYVAAFENRALRPTPQITKELAAEAFDQLWSAFDEGYAMFVLRPEVNWLGLRQEFRAKALNSKSTYEFAGVCAEMLKPLRDLHVWLTVAGADIPVFDRPRRSNFNPAAYQSLLGAPKVAGRSVRWWITPEKVGVIVILNWSDQEIPARFDEVLEEMRETRGLMVDVRMNGGGSEPLAQQVAGRFLENEYVYAHSRVRNGPGHANLSGLRPRKVSPGGDWQYTRPVVVLIGERCMSSNESFVKMMNGATNVVSMGEHTCGSSGNPKIVKLPLDMTVSVPQWIDYLADGKTPLDERGVEPQVKFESKPGDFEGNRDALLEAALERCRKLPMPEGKLGAGATLPMEARAPKNLRKGPEDVSDYSEVLKKGQDANRPRVLAVFPENGATNVDANATLRVRFDRPMNPLSMKLEWNAGGFWDCGAVGYDSNRFEFTIPAKLAGGSFHQVTVNNSFFGLEPMIIWPQEGFQDSEQRLAQFFAWRFWTAGTSPLEKSTNRAQVVSIRPEPGSKVPLLAFVEIGFDRAMRPATEVFPYLLRKMPYDARGPNLLATMEYDAARRVFTAPVVLRSSGASEFEVAGFRDAAGAAVAPVKFRLEANSEDIAPTQTEPSRELGEILARMKAKRAGLQAISERVQTIMMHQDQGLFTRLSSDGSQFSWDGTRFFGDVGDVMNAKEFQVGNDGTNWWWHYQSEKTNILQVCPNAGMGKLNISICDPFGLAARSPEEAIKVERLEFRGLKKKGGAEFFVIARWKAERMNQFAAASRTEWWIDKETLMPAEVVWIADGAVMRGLYSYEPLRERLFSMPKNFPARPVEPLDATYTERFVNFRDGADGNMSLRWGKIGPNARSSSGLN